MCGPGRDKRILGSQFLKTPNASPGGSENKASACSERDLGSIPGLGRSPGGGQPPPVFLPGESPGTEDPGGLQSIMLQRVGHD